MRVHPRYEVDLRDPRAPPHDVWEVMTPAERERVVAELPSELPAELAPPEGDLHRKAKASALDMLGGYFRRVGRKVYLSAELATYYPGQPLFTPDVLAVLDVEPHDRMKWVVDVEGKGLDFVMEVHVAGSETKDYVRNVEWLARLGITEYFVFDRARCSIRGHRLPSPDGRVYQPVMPQAGYYSSGVLGLELAVQDGQLRFFVGGAPLPEAQELIDRLETMVDELVRKRDEAERAVAEERARADEERARADEERARADEERARVDQERARADAAEQRVVALIAELERLRGK